MDVSYQECEAKALDYGRSLTSKEIAEIAICSDSKARTIKKAIETNNPDLFIADFRNRDDVLKFDAEHENGTCKIRTCNMSNCDRVFNSEWAGNRRCGFCNNNVNNGPDAGNPNVYHT